MKSYDADLKRYKQQFYSNECGCRYQRNFIYDRTVANGEVWHCREHGIEIMTNEQPNEESPKYFKK